MTDKECIIIDGVDVSKCKHYERHSFYDCNETCEDNGAIVCTNCEDNPNCYFKQLTHKEQEINNVHEFYEKLRSNATELANKYVQLRRQLKEKEQECKELKKYIQEREVWGDHCEFCKHNDKENCHQNIILDNLKTINRYRKALDEIEKYCNNVLSFTAVRTTEEDILNIINKAKGEL